MVQFKVQLERKQCHRPACSLHSKMYSFRYCIGRKRPFQTCFSGYDGSMGLTKEEIKKRLIKLRNYERLYPELRQKYDELKLENYELKIALENERRERREEVEMLKLQIEELQKIVFGKGKRRNDDDHKGGTPLTRAERRRKARRDKKSYRRQIPLDDEVTEEKYYGIDCCPECKEPLSGLREVIRYKEDIVIPAFTGIKVEKQHIETGFCKHCRKHFSAIPIAKQHCILGENIRMRIPYATTILGMTFEKLSSDLRDTFGIEISDGEIVNILNGEATELLPEYHAIDSRIREAPASQVDETSTPVQKEEQGQWGWVKTASDRHDTIFRLGQSRGKGNATILCNEPNQIVVTDDYAAYDFLSLLQALCWAHPKRKSKDLAKSKSLTDERSIICKQFYKCFRVLMSDVKKVVNSPYNRDEREQKAQAFEKRIKKLFKTNPVDPKKLATLKQTFLERRIAYLTCIREKNIPMTNNKAERAIRPLVIKRKLSFGYKTQKGADIMSILMSVCLTTWWKCQEEKKNFYQAYKQIKQRWQAV